MRALIHQTFGDPAEVLEVVERPLPEPGQGQVRVRTLLAPIHNHDLWTIRGSYGFKPELPAASGTEAVGVIDALGDGVHSLAVGQRVAGGAFGAWAEYFVTRAAGLVPVPESMSDETAAQLVSMPFSALALLDSLDLQPGDWIVQNTANGAVGKLVAQFAPGRGIRVLGLVRRDAGVDELAALGIHDIVSTEGADWRDRAAAVLDGAQPRAAIDSIGSRASGELLSLVGEGGTLVSFGAMESPVLKVLSSDLIFKHATVRGFWATTVIGTMDAAKRVALITELVQRIASGEITVSVEAVYPFEEARAAAAASAVPGRAGKILLRF